MKYKIPYGGAMIGNEEKRAIMKVVHSNYWPLAEQGLKMEKEAAKFLNVSHAILANSGSSAGLLALAALELPKGAEVIIPATTFPTIFNIIPQLGLMPVVVDVNPATNNIDIDRLEEAIGPKTKAIICVHAVGNPCDMPRIMELAAKHNLYVLEDNCDGWGSKIGNKFVGSFAHISFTSFHAAHIVAMGQGGGVFTDDAELARKARMYRDWGRQSDLKERTNNDKWPSLPADYDARFIYEKMGWNLSPLELQAAMGRVQLKKTNKIKKLRQHNFNYFNKYITEKYPERLLPIYAPKDADVCWFAFPVATLVHERGRLTNWLEKKGIETRSLFSGNILKHPAYVNVPHRVGNALDGADWVLGHSFWVSAHPRMTEADRKYVVKAFDDYFKMYPHA